MCTTLYTKVLENGEIPFPLFPILRLYNATQCRRLGFLEAMNLSRAPQNCSTVVLSRCRLCFSLLTCPRAAKMLALRIDEAKW